MVYTQRTRQNRQPMCGLARLLGCLIVSGWLAFVQPGLSYYWLIDPHVHAEIDADRYGQLPDGRMLPRHPYEPPHDHPSSGGLPITQAIQFENEVVRRSQAIFWEANRPSLQPRYAEAAAIPRAVLLDPPEPPPRA